MANLVNLWNIINVENGGESKTITGWLWTEGIAATVQDSMFGVAHWYFAFEYYLIAKTLPMTFKGVKLPEE
jgi:hypothetical protein